METGDESIYASRRLKNAISILDHLVYATPSLESTVLDLETLLGVRAAAGGRHPGRGTRNALIALSDLAYLEIIGPDESSTDPPAWFGIDGLSGPRLVTWAARTQHIHERFDNVIEGRRETADGRILRWQYTDPSILISDGIVPFFIDWGASLHPASSAPKGPEVEYLKAEHPRAPEVQSALAALDINMAVNLGPLPVLIAGLRTSNGVIELK